jgi:hypothetical protein
MRTHAREDIGRAGAVQWYTIAAPSRSPLATTMKRELFISLLALWGVTLFCLAVLDWAAYQSFWLSFWWR